MSIHSIFKLGKDYSKLSDTELVEDCIRGSKRAQEHLTNTLLDPIYRFFLMKSGDSIESEDLTQETFIKIFKSLPNFGGKSALKTWATAIAKYTWLDYLREKYGSIEVTTLDETFIEKYEPQDPHEFLEIKDEDDIDEFLFNLNEEVNDIFKNIKPEYEQILRLRYLESMTFGEISKQIGITENNAKVRHKRALEYVKTHFEKRQKKCNLDTTKLSNPYYLIL